MKNIELFNDHFQNFKSYGIPKAQLIIADVPYNLGTNAYASNPSWYIDGDNKKGESDKAGKQFFDTDKDFRPAEFMHFCSQMLRKDKPLKNDETGEDGDVPMAGSKRKGGAACMILFCPFEQMHYYIDLGRRYGLERYIPLVFRKNFSAQVLKANMKVVGNCEYGLILYRDRLPKFNNEGRMVFNCMDWVVDNDTPKCHPCLPAGEKVYINGKWMNIEDVKVGDKGYFGIVAATQTHIAERIVEIETEDGICRATWNHPFLVKRGNEIVWLNAEQITKNDYILWRKNLKQQKKDTSVQREMENCKWSIIEYGKNILGKFLRVIKSIIGTEIKQTITLKTCNLSLPLNISGYTKVAYLSKMCGVSLVQYVANTNREHRNIGIIRAVILAAQSVKNAIFKNRLQCEKYLLRKVGSVRIIHEKTRVYNLTIEGTPAFDTAIGVSHNCQKPVKLLERLIELFSDKGDVVIDPCAGSGTTLLAAANCGRKAYGFEIKKDFYKLAKEKVLAVIQPNLFQ